MRLLILILLFCTYCSAQSIEEQIDKHLQKSVPKNCDYGISVFSTRQNRFIYERNAEQLLIPASTAKLYTTSTALLFLGEDFSIKSELLTDDGNIKDKVINGNLYFKGYGDPTLTTANLEKMVRVLDSLNVKKITKDIIVDDFFFDEILFREEWIEDENRNVPLPAISGTTLNKNSVAISVRGSSKTNRKPLINFEQKSEYFTIINKATTSGRRVRITITVNEKENGEEIIISGSIPKNRTSHRTVHVKNPPKFIGYALKNILKNKGIDFKGKIKRAKSTKLLNRLSYHETHLKDLISEINKQSNNFYAEHLFKIIGAHYAGEGGGAFDASQAILTFLKTADLYERDLSILDGSGISRGNRFSAHALSKLLSYMYFTIDAFEPFYNSLSIAGVDGTLLRRMTNSFAFNNCRGKTGTLNDVTSLAGYLKTKSNDMLAFVINFNCSKKSSNYFRQLQDDIVNLLCEFD